MKRMMEFFSKIVPLPLVVALFIIFGSFLLMPLIEDALAATNTCGYDEEHYPLPPNTAPCNADNFKFNYDLWQGEGLKVYGDYSLVPGNDWNSSTQIENTTTVVDNRGHYTKGQGYSGYKQGSTNYGEYRFHGFDINGTKYTNIWFPNDANANNSADLSQKRWVYKPWESNVPNEPNYMSRLNDPSNTFYQQYLTTNLGFPISNGIQLPNTPLTDSNPTNYMYVYQKPDLRTPGTGIMWHKSWTSGKIWYQSFHMPEITIDKLPTPVEAVIEVLEPEEPISRKNFMVQSVIPVKVKVIGILKDENLYGIDAKEFAYYTRKDIDYWTISIGPQNDTQVYKIKSNINKVENTGTAEFILNVPVDKISQIDQSYLATAKATVHFFNGKSNYGNTTRKILFADSNVELISLFTNRNPIEFTKASEFKSNNVDYRDASNGDIVEYKITITESILGESQIFTYPTSKVNDADVNIALYNFIKPYFQSETVLVNKQKDFVVEQTIKIKNGKTDKYTQSVVVKQYPENIAPGGGGGGGDGDGYLNGPQTYTQPDLQVPMHGFDIVGVSMSDNTDMSTVQERYCYIDGQSISPSDLFSGNYVFGIGNHGFHQVQCDYVSIDGYEASQVEWIKIWNTKPRVDFNLEGSYKENRKMTITDMTESVNDQIVIDNFPISSYQWEVTTIDGSPLKFKTDTDSLKEFLSNTPGRYSVKLIVTNTLGRVSDPHIVEFQIIKDLEPAVILHSYDAQVSRGGTVKLMYDAVSIDGDSVGVQKVEVFHDSNNDGTFDQLITTKDPSLGFTEFTPPNQLGEYKLVATVEEIMEGVTIPELLDGTEKRTRIVESIFAVDNLQPTNTVYVDIPVVIPKIDAFFLMDKDIARSKNNYVLNNEVTINNQMRGKLMDPGMDTWDMHTYTYSTPASTTRNTGSSYPSSSTYYSSGGYSGTLYRNSVSNDPYSVDKGSYKTKTESRSFSDTCYNVSTSKNGSSGGQSCSSSKSINSDGYSGSIPRTSTTRDWGPDCYTDDKGDTYCTSGWTAHYSGTLSKTVTYWDPNWVSYNDYTGYYSGTLYKSVRHPYDNSFFRTESDKYVVYMSDSNINDIVDLKMVMNNNDAKLILVGQTGMKSQIAHDYFIQNSGQPIEELVSSVIEYIAANNPSVPKYYTLIGEYFNLSFAQFDDENDPIIRDQTMYVHDTSYYDNSLGLEAGTLAAYSTSGWQAAIKKTIINKPGKYNIFRRIQDRPSTDPAFVEYKYFSNEMNFELYAHRRPIAQATLDWDYNQSTNKYKTTWVDNSYDLDHEFSHPEKGIVERKVKYKKSTDSNWTYQIPDELDPGSYTLEYVVKDLEGAWSLPFVLNFTLQPAPPMQLNAKAQTIDTTYTLSSVPASERLSMYDIWTRYPYSHYLSVRLFQGGTARTSETRVNYHTGTKSGNDINWNNITHTIPSTLPDGNYSFRITAIGQGGNTAVMNFPTTVNTPINLVPNFPNEVTVGDAYATRAVTSKYVNATRVTFWKGTGYQTTINLTGTTSGYNKNWTRNYTIPSMPDGNYIVEYQSTTPNGKVQTRQLTVKVINNTPPTAGFELYANNYSRQVPPRSVFEGDTLLVNSTAYDPDIAHPNRNDYMTWRYDLTYPDGTTDVFTEEDPSFRVLQIGTHRLVQTVTDSYGKTDSVTQTFVVGLLEITGKVSHTDKWLEIHNKQANNPNIEFYSGEKFILEADVTVHDIESVRVYFEGDQVNEGTLNLTTDLLQVGSQSKIWNGSLSDNRMVETKTRLKDGWVVFTFVVKYSNGIEKTDEIYVEIIGSVYDPLNYHRSN